MGHVRYKVKRTGKEWVCTDEDWKRIEARMEQTGKRFAEKIGPYEPRTVKHVAPEADKTTRFPEGITRLKGAAPGHQQGGQDA